MVRFHRHVIYTVVHRKAPPRRVESAGGVDNRRLDLPMPEGSYCSCGLLVPARPTSPAKAAQSNFRAGLIRYPFRVKFWAPCKWCGRGKHGVKMPTYCTKACKEASRHADMRAASRQRKGARSCARCGSDMDPSLRADAAFCSEQCRFYAGRDRKGRTHSAEAARRQNLRRLYGLTLEEYDVMVMAQGGTCAICDMEHVDLPRKRLVVDHDHVTGRTRALLCNACNTALGKMRDDADRMRRAADYIERHRTT